MKKFSVNVAEVFGHGSLLAAIFFLQFSELGFNFRLASERFVYGDNFVALREVFILALCQVDGEPLINFGDLLAEVAAARVNDKVERAVRGAVNFNEVIAAAECAQAPFDAPRIFQRTIAVEFLQVETFLPKVPSISARRNVMSGLVDFFKVERVCLQLDGVHAAADVNAHDVRDGLVGHGHCRADCATLARVNVRHDSDFAALREFVIAHAPNLFASRVFDCFGERYRRVKLALNLLHGKISLRSILAD